MKLQWNDRVMARVCVFVLLVLIGTALICSLILGILSLTEPELPVEPNAPAVDEPTEPELPSDSWSVGIAPHARVLSETPDAGQGYIDSMIFIGESTTAHLRSRGVLNGGKDTLQVWADDSNTMTLDLRTAFKDIRFPATGALLSISAATQSAKPDYIVLSFGVNGILEFERNSNLYVTAYGNLIDAIHTVSPETVVLIQTVYPVATNQTTFIAQGALTINEYISHLNALLPTIAEEHDAYVVDTASCLTDARGFLRSDYQNGDGLHLTTAAYVQILNYLRTHAHIE